MTYSNMRTASSRALLLIDFQDDFLKPDGRMPVSQTQVEPVVTAARIAVAEARRAGTPIAAISNEFRANDYLMNLLRRGASLAGSPGSRWSCALPLEGAANFPKWAGSAFVNPDLDPWLRKRGVETLALCGLMAKACIRATAMDALKRGYGVVLIADAIACDSDQSRRKALRELRSKGAEVEVAMAAQSSMPAL